MMYRNYTPLCLAIDVIKLSQILLQRNACQIISHFEFGKNAGFGTKGPQASSGVEMFGSARDIVQYLPDFGTPKARFPRLAKIGNYSRIPPIIVTYSL